MRVVLKVAMLVLLTVAAIVIVRAVGTVPGIMIEESKQGLDPGEQPMTKQLLMQLHGSELLFAELGLESRVQGTLAVEGRRFNALRV